MSGLVCGVDHAGRPLLATELATNAMLCVQQAGSLPYKPRSSSCLPASSATVQCSMGHPP